MRLTVLSDSKAMDGFDAEHGLSFLIEEDQVQVLFDTGASDVFSRNAQKLGIDLGRVNTLVLSHGHWDHGNGLQYISEKPLLCHPGCFEKRFHKTGNGNLGLALSREKIEKRFQLTTSKDPVRLSEQIWFLGEVPRINDFEGKATKYVLEGGAEDYIMDDSGLACITGNGLVVISGCAHSGICNMVEHAVQVMGIDLVEGVVGGFHLMEVNAQTENTIEYFTHKGIRRVYPSHCTMDPALGRFHDEFGMNEVVAGTTIEFI
jgi:7,8-dihydropterin-6-yl-methyl-4-(beta-D-ribofuranosyl)aminobenzene 5'-phosphate synthase